MGTLTVNSDLYTGTLRSLCVCRLAVVVTGLKDIDVVEDKLLTLTLNLPVSIC